MAEFQSLSTELKTPLLTKGDLASKINEVNNISNPEPSQKTKDKSYWIQGIVRNRTQFELKVRSPPYFDSGRYETQPVDVPAFSVKDFSAVNGDNAAAAATGGNAWNLYLQAGIEFNLAFGWTYPIFGSAKSAVVESTTAKDGYDKATKGGNQIVSKQRYTGADTDEREMEILFEVQCTGGQRPVYTITQVIA